MGIREQAVGDGGVHFHPAAILPAGARGPIV
jgi:hypothetical protein